MLNRMNFMKKLQYLYISSIQQLPKTTTQNNDKIKLTHRFLEYFQTNLGESLINDDKPDGHQNLLQLDRNLCNKASQMSNTEILQHLCVYMQTSPREVTDFEFYNISKSILAHRIEELTPQELVQFMYIVALMKKSNSSTKYIKKCLMHINSNPEIMKYFSLTDLIVLCNATFKTSTRINNKELLNILEQILLQNLHLLDDPGMLITLVKTLRHNECQNEELLSTISAVIFFNKTYKNYSFAAISHILPLYADYLYYDEQLFNLFTNCAVESLKTSQLVGKNEYFLDNIRGKDIKRFLWCCSFVGHRLNHKILQIFEEKIYDRVNYGYYNDEPETLIDSVYYLWTLECKSQRLLKVCKTKVDIVRRMQTKTKIRINMLLVCMQIEDLKLYKSFGHKVEVFKPEIKKELERRPLLVKVYDVLKQFMSDLDVNRLEFEFQVPHFNIMGISGYRKNIYKAFVVEVLDDTNMVKNVAYMGSGRFQLKLRLMYKMDLTVVVLNASDFQNLNDMELKDYIRKEMSIVS